MTKHMSIALRNFLFSTVAAGLAALRSAAHFTTPCILTCKNLDNMESSRAKGSWVKPRLGIGPTIGRKCGASLVPGRCGATPAPHP